MSKLKVVEFQAKEPFGKADMIACLEDILDRVRNNEIDGMVCAVTYVDGATGSSRAGAQGTGLLGRLEYVKARMVREIMEDDDK